jgi:surface antigen
MTRKQIIALAIVPVALLAMGGTVWAATDPSTPKFCQDRNPGRLEGPVCELLASMKTARSDIDGVTAVTKQNEEQLAELQKIAAEQDAKIKQQTDAMAAINANLKAKDDKLAGLEQYANQHENQLHEQSIKLEDIGKKVAVLELAITPTPTPAPTPTDSPSPSPSVSPSPSASPTPSASPEPQACGGGYPARWCNAPLDSLIDNWGMYNRECVSYAAYKIVASGRTMPYWGGHGNANQWPANARAAGIPVDGNPKVGDVAISMAGPYGFAMYVEAVQSDGKIHVSQYNYDNQGEYSEMTISPGGLYFIHF